MTSEELEAIYKYMSTAERIRTLRAHKLDSIVARMTELLAKRAAELKRLGLVPPREGTKAYEAGLEMLMQVEKDHDEYKHNVTKEFERPLCFVSAAKGSDEFDSDIESVACFSEEQYSETVKKLEERGYSCWRYNRGEDEYEQEFVTYCEDLQGLGFENKE